jgi:Na+/melibiose symporter-like transporter
VNTPAALPARAGLAYGALGLPLAFLALPLYVSLPQHYAQQHGVPLALLGLVLLLTRSADALLDPLIGQGVDRLFGRSLGAVRGLALLAGLLLGLGFAALFFPPWRDYAAAPAPLLGWLVASLVFTYLAFSALSVLHQAWGTRLGGDAPQRARVVAWREGCGLVGVLLASVLPSLLGLAWSTGVLLLSLALGLALLLRGAPRPPATAAAAELHAAWRAPLRNKPFRGLLAVFMANGIASAVPATLLIFFVQDRLQDAEGLPLYLSAYFLAAALSVPLWLRLVARLGLSRGWLLGMGLAVLAFAGALALPPGARGGFLAVCLASGVALGADLALPGALLTGLVQRADHGALSGAYAGWWTAASKLNLGLAAGAALPLLALAGYTPGARAPEALQALGLAYVALPCALKLLAVALLWHWARGPGAEP